MRVAGGRAKGTQLRVPPGRLVRPTTSLAKQAVFSSLEATPARWHRVLDLFAGSGALGIEALSHYAQWADFVEQSRKCCDVIRLNLAKAGFRDKAHVYCCSVSKALGLLSGEYDIVFMDPPYSEPSVGALLATLAGSRLLGKGAMVVVCHANRFPLDPDYDGVRLVRQRHYGDTFVSMYRRED
jgi:16S rRNA (guanine966-N2)-methyltransferase